MLKTRSDAFKDNLSVSKVRPRSSVTKRSIDIYAQAVPLHRRIKHAYHMSSVTDINKGCPTAHRPKDSSKSKIDSDQPETIYNWLDEFQHSIASKAVGTPFEYPVAKYQQSVRLVDSQGYKNVKTMQKQEKLPRFVKVMRDELRKIHEKFETTQHDILMTKTNNQ